MASADPARTSLVDVHARFFIPDDVALREIDRATGELDADGFVLVTNYGGRYLATCRSSPSSPR